MRRLLLGLLAGAGLALAPGCAKVPPQYTEVRGVVLLDGKPLPKVRVEFVPQLKDFGAQYNSSALTDDEGRFTLAGLANKSGAVVGRHKVVVADHVPDEFRGQEAQTRYAQYLAGLKNRPVPPVYANPVQTPLEVEVKKDQQEYPINLTRKQ